jgi:hypothetical protein
MKKIIVLLLALALILAMSVTAFAVTPKWEYKPVKLPQIKPDTSFVQGAVAKWFIENPIDLPAINISYTRPVLG